MQQVIGILIVLGSVFGGFFMMGGAFHQIWQPIELIVIATAIRVAYEASMHLMDTMPEDQAMDDIRRAAASVPDVVGIEKCYARKTGLKYHVDLHLEVDPEITVRASHEIAGRVREKVCDKLPWVADVLIHVEPAPERSEQRS